MMRNESKYCIVTEWICKIRKNDVNSQFTLLLAKDVSDLPLKIRAIRLKYLGVVEIQKNLAVFRILYFKYLC